MRVVFLIFLVLGGMKAATFVDDQVNDLAARIRRLAERESAITRPDTLARLERLLAGAPETPRVPQTTAADAGKLLDQMEHGRETVAGYEELAALVRRDGISTGTDNPAVRSRVALAELAELLRTDADAALPELRRLRGRTVVVSFWATWCGPCQAEMPVFEKLHREGIAVLAVTDEKPEIVEAFIASRKLTLPVVYDPARKAFDRFAAATMPSVRIVDGNGRVKVEAGEIDEEELRRLLTLRR